MFQYFSFHFKVVNFLPHIIPTSKLNKKDENFSTLDKLCETDTGQPSSKNILTQKNEKCIKPNESSVDKHLYQETMDKSNSHRINTPSWLKKENEELKECSFKPTIGKTSKVLANAKKRKEKIEDALTNDAKQRKNCKINMEQSVSL